MNIPCSLYWLLCCLVAVVGEWIASGFSLVLYVSPEFPWEYSVCGTCSWCSLCVFVSIFSIVLGLVYVLFVRSILEESATVWHSSPTEENTSDLKRVQKSDNSARTIQKIWKWLGPDWTTDSEMKKKAAVPGLCQEMCKKQKNSTYVSNEQ